MVTGGANIISIKYEVAYMGFQLAYLYLTLTRSQGQDQAHLV